MHGNAFARTAFYVAHLHDALRQAPSESLYKDLGRKDIKKRQQLSVRVLSSCFDQALIRGLVKVCFVLGMVRKAMLASQG
jgi:hypothetical protein